MSKKLYIINIFLFHLLAILLIFLMLLKKSHIPIFSNIEYLSTAIDAFHPKRVIRLFIVALCISPVITCMLLKLRQNKIQKFLLILFLFSFSLTLTYLYPHRYIKSSAFIDTEIEQGILIAHAAGSIENRNYTNSEEALIKSLKNNYKFFELDMLVTDDNRILAAHDWENFHKRTNTSSKELEKIKNVKIDGSFTLLYDEKILEYFEKNPDIFLVTDKIKNFDLVKQNFPFYQDRILIEVFSLEDYFQALKIGFKYPMLCIWNSSQLDRYYPMLKSGVIAIMTCPVALIKSDKEKLEVLHKRGINIFAFTSNEIGFINKHLGKTVSGFYTDTVLPSFFKEENNNEK